MAIARVEQVSYGVAGFGDALTHDLAHGVPAAREFFPAQKPAEVIAQIERHAYPRDAVVTLLERSALQLEAPAPVLENVRRLREPRTFVVATGQQAGFLGGPLYTLHKSLTTIKLARQLEAEHPGAHFVPLFWVASDDHDLAEIDHADFVNEAGELVRVQATPSAQSAGCSACDAFVDPQALPRLREELAALPSTQASAASLIELYAGRSFADAFSRLLLKWLGQFGLVVAQAHELRALGKDLLLRELAEHDVVSRLVQEDGLKLQRAGYKPGFGQFRGAPHFFIMTEPGRVRAHLDAVPGDETTFRERSTAFAAKELQPRTYSRKELAELIAARPELFSASAALRPVLQQTIFPVVAAVLGPGEIAYWAQLRRVHEHLGAVWPVVVPRATMTLVDSKTEKAARKLDLDVASPDLFLDFTALRRHAATTGDLAQRLQERRARILEELRALAADVHTVDAGLQPMFDKAQARIAHVLERIAEKTQESVRDREGTGESRVRRVSSMVRPRNGPQERLLSCAQFLTSYPDLCVNLLEKLDPRQRAHMVVLLS